MEVEMEQSHKTRSERTIKKLKDSLADVRPLVQPLSDDLLKVCFQHLSRKFSWRKQQKFPVAFAIITLMEYTWRQFDGVD